MSAKHKPAFTRIAQLKTKEAFLDYLSKQSVTLPFDPTPPSPGNNPLAQPYPLKSGRTIGNRFCILPMEGWDGTTDGKPTHLTKRRWNHFAISGAKLLWGCEAVAVRPDGRANPNQLIINPTNLDDFKKLFEEVFNDHRRQFGQADDLVVGLQLTHSGRFCKPHDSKKFEPKIAYAHPLLNKKFGLPNDYPILSDDDISLLIDDIVKAAALAHQAGFHFVDVKHCHGYLGHELLSAVHREGAFGGSFENRTAFLRKTVEGIRATSPGLEIGVRLSAFDFLPFMKSENGTGIPEMVRGNYPYSFGGTGLAIDLKEPIAFLKLLEELGIELACLTAGSPYYNPHITRPALFPPSDGYLPPEEPLVGVARHIQATAELKKLFPGLAIVGSGYSYLQEWLPPVAKAVVQQGMTDFVGLGRLVLSYPSMPDDILKGKPLDRNLICRTFSDCTTAPRNGMVSGCYPLDPFYKAMPEATALKEIKHEK